MKSAVNRPGLRLPGLGEFLTWWRDGLLAWLPARWRARLVAPPRRLLLQREGGQLQLWSATEGQIQALASLPWPLPEAGLERVLAPAARLLPRYWLLPSGQVLRRPLRLPATARPQLHAVVGFEIDRQTPFAADQVSHDVHVLAQSDGQPGGQLDVELVVLPLNVVEQVRADAGPLASSLSGIDVAIDGQRVLGVNLLPPALRSRPRRGNYVPSLVLLLAGGVLLWLGGERILDNRQQALAGLQQQVQQQARQAREVASQRQQLQALVDGARFFDAQRSARPTTVEVWEELSARLPDGTVLEKLSIEGEQLQLIGMSDQAASLVDALEGSPLWSRPALSGVLQAEPGQRRDRFTLGASLGASAGTGPAGGNDGR